MLTNPFDALTRRVATTRLSRRGAGIHLNRQSSAFLCSEDLRIPAEAMAL